MAPRPVDPMDYSVRSPVTRALAGAGARFATRAKAAVAIDFGTPDDELARAAMLGLADLSPLPRTGYKGGGALDWLRAQGVVGLDADNRATRQPDGAVAARLAPGEALLLGDIGATGGLCARLDAAWSEAGAPGCYPVRRDAASFWFVVTGKAAATLFAKLCGVDLRPAHFPEGAVAQTSLARLNTIIVRQDMGVLRQDMGAVPAYHLLGDSASAEYFWDCLIDAMAEFTGDGAGPVGLAALDRLTAAG